MNAYAMEWVVFILVTLGAAVGGTVMNERLHDKHPQLKSYIWGYFFGLVSVLAAASLITLIPFVLFFEEQSLVDLRLFQIVIVLLIAIPNFFILKRHRWAWIVATLVTCNPVFWVINGIYVKNRWIEMGGTPRGESKLVFDRSKLTHRAILAGLCFWVILVVSFIFLFEPYGDTVDSREIWRTIKAITIPPAILFGGYFLYIKVMNNKN